MSGSSTGRHGVLIGIIVSLAAILILLVGAIVVVQVRSGDAGIQSQPPVVTITETQPVETGVEPTSPSPELSTVPGSILSDTPAVNPAEDSVAAGQTEIRTVSPVNRNFDIQDGWSPSANTTGVEGDCYPSPVALDPDIYTCGPSAASMNACYISPASNLLGYCPNGPFSREYRPIQVMGDLKEATVESQPYPWGLELDDGRLCTARQGGAWGSRADGGIGTYSCTGGDTNELGLVMPGDHSPNGVDMSGPKWTLKMGAMGSPDDEFPAPRTVGVAIAYFAAWSEQ
ncbi:hypothetical protein [Corynebacterium sp. A21]|uniref:hypothetical protein n=1 Tax=Corynebacterium sp. A21 TaxID=3457318 RepID=UPI003FD20384